MTSGPPLDSESPDPFGESGIPVSPLTGARFRIGSLRCRVETDPDGYAELFTERYRAELETTDGEDGSSLDRSDRNGIGDELVFELRTARSAGPATTDRLVVERTPVGHRLVTDPVTVELADPEPATGQRRVRVWVNDPDLDRELLSFHFWIVLNRALLLLDRVMLHAAAFVIDGRVVVVCGDNGAGKSTLSIAVGLRGGALLSEDSVLATRRDGAFVVSGVSPQMRVPRPTEDRLLPGRLVDRRISEDGRNKRLVAADQLFISRWGEDLPPDLLVFLRPGDRVHAQSLRPRDTLVALIGNTRHSYRFAATNDIADHLGLVTSFAAAAPAFEVTRSGALDDLDTLVEVLREL